MFAENVSLHVDAWEVEVDYFLMDSQNTRVRVKGVVEEANNVVEHVRGEPIQVKYLSNNFKLCMKVFIAETKIENAMNQTKN